MQHLLWGQCGREAQELLQSLYGATPAVDTMCMLAACMSGPNTRSPRPSLPSNP